MKTVVHLTSADAGDWGHALRSVALLNRHEELAHDAVTLLPHRAGVRLVAPGSAFADEVSEAIEGGVTVRVGESCFDALELPLEVLPGVETVASGVSELVRLQSEGYNYVKIP